MRHAALSATLLVAGAMLAACAGGSSARTGLTITPETKLALGTLKLEGTPQAVDKVTAAKLLPLWQLLQQLNTGTSTAPQEVAAVLAEIQATMTPEQRQAIESMQITEADFLTAFQQARSAASAGSTGGTRTSGSGNSSRSGGQAFFFGGGPPGGGFPGGGFSDGAARNSGTGTPSASQGSTSLGTQGTANRGATFVVAEVVRLLESKIGT